MIFCYGCGNTLIIDYWKAGHKNLCPKCEQNKNEEE